MDSVAASPLGLINGLVCRAEHGPFIDLGIFAVKGPPRPR